MKTHVNVTYEVRDFPEGMSRNDAALKELANSLEGTVGDAGCGFNQRDIEFDFLFEESAEEFERLIKELPDLEIVWCERIDYAETE